MQPHYLNNLREEFPQVLPWAIASVVLLLLLSGWRGLGLWLRPAGGRREPPLWGPLDVLLGVVVWFGIQLMGPPILSSLGVTTADALLEPRGQTLLQALTWFLTCGFVFLLVRRGLGQPLSTLGLRRPRWASVVFTILVFGLSFFPISVVMAFWIAVLHDLAGLDLALQDSVTLIRSFAGSEGREAAIAYLLVGPVILAPVGEEIFFRGFMFGCFRERLGLLLGAVLSSFLFALLHLSLAAFAPLFLIGCILCFISHRTGSIYPAMLFHFLFNASACWSLLTSPND